MERPAFDPARTETPGIGGHPRTTNLGKASTGMLKA